MTPPYRIELLLPSHDRTDFDCGVSALDRYFREQVTQDVRRRVTACYVLIEAATGAVAGFYTLAAASLPLTALSQAHAKQLPRYPSIPVARVGRLAVSSRNQGQGLGAAMMSDAAQRAIRSEIAVYALVVDAKGDAAAAFYEHLGFVPLAAPGRQWVQPLKNLSRLI